MRGSFAPTVVSVFVAALLAACGHDDPPEQVVAGDSETIVLPDVGPTVTRDVLLSAMTADVSIAVTASTPDTRFTEYRRSASAGTMRESVALRALDAPSAGEATSTVLRVDATGADIALAADATLESTTVPAVGAPTAVALVGMRTTLPDRVPLDRVLAEWRSADATHALRLSLGSVGKRSDRMRICIRVERPSQVRTACLLASTGDGTALGTDVTYESAGATVEHLSSADGAAPRGVLPCTRTVTDRGTVIERVAGFEVFEFTPPILRIRGTTERDFDPVESPPTVQKGRETLADGTTTWWYTGARVRYEVDVTPAGAVRRYESGGGLGGYLTVVSCGG